MSQGLRGRLRRRHVRINRNRNTMKRLFVLLPLLFATLGASAQQVAKSSCVYKTVGADTLRLDRYETAPAADGARRPCLLFVFGGGFVNGSRDDARYVPFFEYYARQGYVVVSIDYRLGLKLARANGPLDAERFAEAFAATLSMATNDLFDATAHVLTQAEAWGIDPERIVTCGSSAGAITVLMGEYALCNAHPATRRLPAGFRYAGVVSFAGAIFDTQERMRWATRPAPMLLFHGDADRNVPYDALYAMGAGFFGSKHIAGELRRMGPPYMFYSAENTDHSMALTPMEENRYEIDAFLEKLVMQHLPLQIRTEATSLDRPAVDTRFTLTDYLEANYAE